MASVCSSSAPLARISPMRVRHSALISGTWAGLPPPSIKMSLRPSIARPRSSINERIPVFFENRALKRVGFIDTP